MYQKDMTSNQKTSNQKTSNQKTSNQKNSNQKTSNQKTSNQKKEYFPSDGLTLINKVFSMRRDGKDKNDILKFLHSNYGKLEIRHETDKSIQTSINNERTILYIVSSKGIDTMFNIFNGIVFHAETAKILAFPIPIFNQATNSLKIQDMNVYNLNDMTNITLYYDRKWRISTSKAYDMTNISFIKTTYAEIFYELITVFCPKFALSSGIELNNNDGKFEIRFTNLNINYCYSFLIRHECLQPIISLGDNEILLIRIVELFDDKLPEIVPKESYESYGIPLPTPIELTTDMKSIRELECMTDSIANAQKYVEGKSPFYGYAFIPKDEKIDSKYYIIQSPLLDFLKRNIYSKFPENTNINPSNRLLFIQMRSYLSTSRLDVLKLAPEWKSKFNEFDIFIEDLRNQVVGLYRETRFFKRDSYQHPKLEFAKKLIDQISLKLEHSSLQGTMPYDGDYGKLVMDYINDTKNTEIFVKLLDY